MGKTCHNRGCPGHDWICKCDYACWLCRTGRMASCGGNGANDMLEPYRIKYVCFKCRHIFKEKYTKYENWERLWRRYNGPRCNQCGGDVIELGPNFRHCKTEKHWKELERKIDTKEIDPEQEFTYCPTNRYKTQKNGRIVRL